MIKYRTDKRFKFMILFMCILMVLMSAVPMITGIDSVSATTSLAGSEVLIIFKRSELYWVSSGAKIYVCTNVTTNQWDEATLVNNNSSADYIVYSYILPSGANGVRIARYKTNEVPGGSYSGELYNNSENDQNCWNWSGQISNVIAGDILQFDAFGRDQSVTNHRVAALKPSDVVYYDTGNNHDQWNTNDNIYMYVGSWFNVDDGKYESPGFLTFTENSDYLSSQGSNPALGKILTYTIPQNVIVLTKASYSTDNCLIFSPYNNWNQAGETTGDYHYRYFQTINYNPEDVSGKVVYYNNFSQSERKVTLAFYPQANLATAFDPSGKTFNVVDMTGTLANKTITCTYKDVNNANSTSPYSATFGSDGKATITVPAVESVLGKWKSVTLQCNGVNLLTDEELETIKYDTDNTFYYGITTANNSGSQGEAVYSEWGAPNRAGTAITSKALYLNRSSFGSNSNAPELDSVAMTTTSNPVGTGNYSHYSSAQTQNADHIYHLKTDSYFYNFYWTDSTKDLVTLSSNAASVSEVHNDATVRTIYFDATFSKLSYEGTESTAREMPLRTGGGINAVLYDASGNRLETRSLSGPSTITKTDANYGTRIYNDLYSTDVGPNVKYVMFYCGTTEPSKQDAVMGQTGVVTYISNEGWEDVNVYLFDEDDNNHNTNWTNKSIVMNRVGNTNVFTLTEDQITQAIHKANGGNDYGNAQIIFRKSDLTAQNPAFGSGGYQIRYDGTVYGKHRDTSVHGEATYCYEIPVDKTSPCFYADTSDDTIFNGGRREGYWEEVGTLRDAEKGKKIDTVDIAKKTFKQAADTKYVPSTFYDYYSDYEMNGFNRKTYDVDANGASQKNWVTFRQFDQALSDYYQSANVAIPLYSGHFQPDYTNDNYGFSKIANTLNLYKYASSGTDYWKFFSTNNSNFDVNGNSGKYGCATPGLVYSQTSDGTLTGSVMTSNKEAILPFFNKEFLLGKNAKNTKIGDVYENVSFPFKRATDTDDGASYWTYDSALTTLAFLKDPTDDHYYLEQKGETRTEGTQTDASQVVNNDPIGWSYNVNSKGTNEVDSLNGISTKYGFYPLNYGYTKSTEARGSTYNFCFGTSMNFSFMTTTGQTDKVPGSDTTQVPIKFKFSGDDDVWIFIDGQLELDLGGDHGRVGGTIDFYDGTWNVDGAKSSAAKSNPPTNGTLTRDYKDGKKHTLTIYYMERGMWESNMKVQFNASMENSLSVEKEVNTDNVNSAFSSFNSYVKDQSFPIDISVLSTHNTDTLDYGSKTSGTLQSANNVAYTHTKPSGSGYTSTEKTATNGQINLKDDESAHFQNKFDTGEYLKIEETISDSALSSLFDTTWSMKEDNLPITVTSYTGLNKSGRIVSDVRNESAYETSTHNKPSDTFLYRSFSKPSQEYVDLTVNYKNTVKTGSVQINKRQYTGSNSLKSTSYYFLLKCWNIGGLSGDPKVTTPVWFKTAGVVKDGNVVITGIPAGTSYTIYEIDAADGSKPRDNSGTDITSESLESITYNDIPSSSSKTGSFAKVYPIQTDTVTAGDTASVDANNAFYVGAVSVTKVWSLVTNDKKTDYVQVQLQRSNDGSSWDAITTDAYGTAITTQNLNDGNSWSYTFSNLPLTNDDGSVIYHYRIVEYDPYKKEYITDTSTQTFNDGVGVTYSDANITLSRGTPSSVTITNSLTNVIVMPETGGTPLIYLFPFGIIAIALSGAALVIYKKKLQGASFFVKRKGRSD